MDANAISARSLSGSTLSRAPSLARVKRYSGLLLREFLVVYALKINLNALIVYANGIFIMLYLLCMLAGCRLLKGRCYALAVTGCLLCLLLLAMLGWKSLYAIIMLAALWLFLPKRKRMA